MKKTVYIIAALLSLSSCKFVHIDAEKFMLHGNGIVCDGEVENRVLDSLSGFDSIELRGYGELVVVQSDSCRVSVKANNDAFPHLDCKVEDGLLTIGIKDNVRLKTEDFEVTVSLPLLRSLLVKGAGDLEMDGYTSSTPLDLEINGAGDMEVERISVPELSVTIKGAGDLDLKDIDVNSLKVEIKGAGDASLSGRAGSAEVSIAGAGDVDASGLKVDEWKQNKSGLGSIRR